MSTLADLRRQNIAEQKSSEAPVSDALESFEAPSVREQARTDERNENAKTSDDQAPSPANPQIRNTASKEVRKQVSTSASPQARKQVSASASKEASPQASTDSSTDALTQVLRDALASKRTHSGGVKTTVEMSPELSKRAKKYCLENDVVSLRVLCLELLEGFLTEEGF